MISSLKKWSDSDRFIQKIVFACNNIVIDHAPVPEKISGIKLFLDFQTGECFKKISGTGGFRCRMKKNSAKYYNSFYFFEGVCSENQDV
jgi:hypothetical protein